MSDRTEYLLGVSADYRAKGLHIEADWTEFLASAPEDMAFTEEQFNFARLMFFAGASSLLRIMKSIRLNDNDEVLAPDQALLRLVDAELVGHAREMLLQHTAMAGSA